MTRDHAASVKAHLLGKSKAAGERFELSLVRYACERFLYRLGASTMRYRCILKGAGLLALWMRDPWRATRDVDLLAFGGSDEAAVRAAMETICSVTCPEDGLIFDLGSIVASPTRVEQGYPGQRAVLWACLGRTRIRVQVDFGFGDAVVPEPDEVRLPTLIDRVPAPRIRAYPRVVAVAEKFQAMVDLGRRNSRMKDFHDVWDLSEAFAFDGTSLREAVLACFDRRGTPWTVEKPVVLEPVFYSDVTLQARWRAYLRAGHFRSPPPEAFEDVGERVFFNPVRGAILRGVSFEMHWPVGGSWEPIPARREINSD